MILVNIFIFLLIFRIIILEKHYLQSIMYIKDNTSFIGYVSSYPEIKNNKINFKVKVIKISYENTYCYKKIKSFNVLIVINNNYGFKINRGDAVEIRSQIRYPCTSINGFNYKEYLFFHNIYGAVYTNQDNIYYLNDENLPLSVNILKNTIWEYRSCILYKLNKYLNNESYSFILSIFFGQRGELDKDLYQKFIDTGLLHLLAISGLHIGFIGLLIYRVFKFFLSKIKSLILSNIFLILYIIIIAPSASSLRAFLMYLLFSIYFISGKKTIGLTVLSLSSIILLLVNPYYIFDLGFQFSFLAVCGIIFLAQNIKDKLHKIIPDKIKSLISVSFSAFISIALLQWAIFKKLALFSVISSIFMVPLFGLLFSILLILIIIFITTSINLTAVLINFLISIFIKCINLLNNIPPLYLPKISYYLSFLLLPLLIIYFYIIDPLIFKKIINLKIKKLNLKKINEFK